MCRSGKLALAGLVSVTLLGAAFMQSRAYGLYFNRMPFGEWLVAAAGWIIATYGPVLVAISLWRSAKYCRNPWALHLLLLPILYVMLVAGSRLILTTLYVPDFDATLGAPILPAFVSIVATVTIYFFALVAEGVSRSGGRENVR